MDQTFANHLGKVLLEQLAAHNLNLCIYNSELPMTPVSIVDHQEATMDILRGEAEAATATTDAAVADQWKKTEMAKMIEKHEKLSHTIDSWKDNKSKKARRKLNRAEEAMAKRKIKALLNYKDDIECITRIAEGAREQAKEKRRNEELKVKEKANIMRATGRVPPSCF